MRIGIVGPFNPLSVIDYLDDTDVKSINETATAVNTLVREFLAQGHQVKVFTLSTTLPNLYRVLKGRNIEIVLIPTGIIPRFLGFHQMAVGSFYLPQRIARCIKKRINDVDVLHAHWTYEYARAASFFSTIIPVFDTVRDWCPYQMTLQKNWRGKYDWKLKHMLFKKVMADSSIYFIANSSYTYQMIIGHFRGKKVSIIPNPIESSWILRSKLKQVSNTFISISTNVFDPRKNIECLLDAFRLYRNLYPEAVLHLIGRYEENDVFRTWKQGGKLVGVVFHGAIPHSDLASLLDDMSCLIHPSLEETFGNILLEAMSRCVICIGGDKSGAVPEVLGYGEFGFLCDITSAQSIFDAMLKTNNLELVNRIQRQATEMLINSYSSTRIVEKHIELFRSVSS